MKLDNPYLLFKKQNLLFWIFLPLLFLLSIIYGFVVYILKFSYKRKLLPTYIPRCKVISVGNITLGGTGKTPLVEWIVNFLIKNNKKPGVIIRGYKRPKSREDTISIVNNDYFQIGDEAKMLRENLNSTSIYVGTDKIKSAKLLEKENHDVAVLDDGFQHWRLGRDLDVVTIDCSFLISNQKLLPLGRLRETLNSLKRADIFILTKTDLSQDYSKKNRQVLNNINPNALIVSSIYEPVCFYNLKSEECISLSSDYFATKSVCILTGIANPIYFDKILSKLRLKIKQELAYSDHYEYKERDLDYFRKLVCDINIDTIITTHKDAVKLRHFINYFKDLDIFYLKIKLKIVENEEEFSNRLLSVFTR